MKYAPATLVLAFLPIPWISSYATMTGTREIVIDFRNTDSLAQQVLWSDPLHVVVTKDGLKLAMDPRDGITPDQLHLVHRNVWVETAEPIAVGWSWRPVKNCNITVRKYPPGEFQFTDNSVIFPSGSLYVRYSADAVHWSTWQGLPTTQPEPNKGMKHEFRGDIRVPDKEQKQYQKKVMEYSRMDVPWGSDEEAAVKWILRDNPEFFSKNLPFIGYVQFLYEQSLAGDETIERIEIQIRYGAGGIHMPPRDESLRNQHRGPWRFKAPATTERVPTDSGPVGTQN